MLKHVNNFYLLLKLLNKILIALMILRRYKFKFSHTIIIHDGVG